MTVIKTTKLSSRATGNLALSVLEGTSNCGSSPQSAGVFVVPGNVGQSIAGLLSATITEGTEASPFFGDAVFEVISAMWNLNGDVRLHIGQWDRFALEGGGNRYVYRQDLPFVITLLVEV